MTTTDALPAIVTAIVLVFDHLVCIVESGEKGRKCEK